MSVINPPAFLHNVTTTTAQTDRLARVASLQPGSSGVSFLGGVRGNNDFKVVANATPDMTVNVGAGIAIVTGSLSTFQGQYVVTNDGDISVIISAAHATLARRDLIVVRVQDSFYAGALNTASVEVVTGTAAASPVDPTVPANCLIIGRVRVTAAVVSIGSSLIDDIRPYAAALGGIVRCTSTSRPAHVEGMAIYEKDTKNLYVSDGSTWNPVGANTTYAAKVQRTTAQSIPASTTTAILWNSVVRSSTGMTPGPISQGIKCMSTGTYLLNAVVSLDNAFTSTEIISVYVYVNGSIAQMLRRDNGPTANVYVVSVCCEIELNLNDVVSIAINHGDAAAVNTSISGSYFPELSIRKVY